MLTLLIESDIFDDGSFGGICGAASPAARRSRFPCVSRRRRPATQGEKP
jgi:hypothetical protein